MYGSAPWHTCACAQQAPSELMLAPCFFAEAGRLHYAHQGWLCSYGFSWDGKNNKPNLGNYYLTLGDKVHEVCKSCIFLLEGTGQSNFLGVDW